MVPAATIWEGLTTMGVLLMVAVIGEAPTVGLKVVLGRMTLFEETTTGMLPTRSVVCTGAGASPGGRND